MFRQYTQSRLSHVFSFSDAVFTEININMRKTTSRKEVYVTGVSGYRALILIHNTGTDKHSFYSLAIHKDDFMGEDDSGFEWHEPIYHSNI
jgi:hypothetical protein